MNDEWYPSRWGVEDEAGALNLVSSVKVSESARLVKKGKIYSLAQLLEDGIPVPSYSGAFHYSTFRRHGEGLKLFGVRNKFAALNTRLEITDHTGTHIDGLNHVSIDGRVYNGIPAEEITGTFGTSRLGIENMPAIFTRGVLVDVASFKGMSRLDPAYVITSGDIQSTLRHESIEIRSGDALIIGTGWSQLWMSDNQKYSESCPGINLSAAQWIASQEIAVVGADTWNVEVEPAEEKDTVGIVHQHLVAKSGIRLIENLNLEQLRRDGIVEFLFVCLPLRIRGGAGSPLTPIAVT